MIPFRYIGTLTDKRTKPLDRQRFDAMVTDAFVISACTQARMAHQRGDKAAYERQKTQLPLVFWCGFNKDGKREAEALTPTQFYIMDIDHTKKTCGEIVNELVRDLDVKKLTWHAYGIYMIHETPSNGVRMVCKCIKDFPLISEHQQWLANELQLGRFGDVDLVVKDISRGSFMVQQSWIHYIDYEMFNLELEERPIMPVTETTPENGKKSTLPEITDKERDFEFNGKLVREIAEDYIIDQGGVPEEGLRHGFYNDLIKNFRNICNSDPRIVFAVLPLCEGTPEKRWSQVTSICKTNNTTQIPKDFYFWMKKRGYIVTKKDKALAAFMEKDEDEPREPLPTLPPVFKEFCSVCPPDFVYPTIVALMPVMGTLTSYVKATYIDLSEQTTTFFACVWGPPSSGKSFAKKIVDILMQKIKLRDEVNDMREQLWLVDERTKAKDDKGQDLPHVMVRIMPAINSLPEFLEKMRDNRGYHMFTMAEEVDTFKKGSASGGADKSDLFRTAWDNSEYGQSFRSANTFKGKVKVYYNILLTGTPGAVKKYYDNVEDGMVTRISICEIENQQFAKFQAWKPFTKKAMEVIDRFVDRCDSNTYRDPLDIDHDEIHLYDNNSKNFDSNIKWKFTLNPRQEIDMSWLTPSILEWLEETRIKASLSNDAAMDVFRRRAAVKGFRLGMVCWCCWAKVNTREKNIIINFVRWFMTRDLQESLKFFGNKYNKLQNDVATEVATHQSLFEALPDEFTKNDVIAQCIKQGIKSRVRQIIFRWHKDKAVVKIGTDKYRKSNTKKP